MASLTVDRLDVRYHGMDTASASRLDEALVELLDRALDRALMDTPLAGAFAVCLPELRVDVGLDLRRPVAVLAADWATELAAAVAARLEALPRHPVGAGTAQAVIWRHEVDALVDLVRSVARHDSSRLWAWRNVGLVSASTVTAGRGEVAAALAARPLLAPGVLRATSDLGVVPLSDTGWIQVAVAVDQAASPTWGSSGPPLPAGRAAALARLVPRRAWLAAGERTRSLAVLALAVGAPERSRDADAIRSVGEAVDVGGGPEAAVAVAPQPPAATLSPSLAGPRPPSPETGPAPSAGDGPEPEPGAQADRPDQGRAGEVVTEWGGAFFLISLLGALDWTACPPSPELVARALVAITGAPSADPAVLAVAGWPSEEPVETLTAPPSAALAGAVERVAVEARAHLVARTDGAGRRRAGQWIWRRRAVIEATPGWIDVRYALDDVDVSVRAAGLDLDPGYVWWLGAVVRFVYA